MTHSIQPIVFSLKHISVSINGKEILKNISLDIYQGDFIIIVGGNGAGKSTLFDVIGGKRSFEGAGDIIYENKSIKLMSEVKRAHFITRIFQNTHTNCVGSLSVLENIALSIMKIDEYGFSLADSREIRKKAEAVLRDLDMPLSLLSVPMFSLSGGQRQLLSFMMSMFLCPNILLLDEPTAALDPQAATKLLMWAKKCIAERGIIALLITHDPYIAMHLGNRLCILEDGQIKKIFDEDEKKKIIDPAALLGKIDYEKLSQ